ncbi:MAG: radical SAM protein [bacterium]
MKYLFGPVPSRRLGYSLGIDLVPHKTCTFDCIYCEVGKTTNLTVERQDFNNADEIIKETVDFISSYTGRIDFITFTGSGEPTLNIKLGYIAREIRKATKIPLALITNTALFNLEEVRKDAMEFDVILPSLDSVTEESFKAVNKPHRSINLESVIEGLMKFAGEYKGKILLEILFVKGMNDSDKEIMALRRILEKIHVDKIQINTVVRPPAYSSAKPIDEADRERIKNLLGDKVEVELAFTPGNVKKSNANEDDVKRLLMRRPCTYEQISSALGILSDELNSIIEKLEINNSIRVEKFGEEFYYSVKNDE